MPVGGSTNVLFGQDVSLSSIAYDDIKKGLQESNDEGRLTNEQPLKAVLYVFGLHPNPSVLNNAWKCFVFLAIVAHCVLIFYLASLKTLFSTSMLIGTGIISLATVPAYVSTVRSLRAGHLDVGASILRLLSTGGHRTVRATTLSRLSAAHVGIGTLFALFFVVYWQTVTWLSFESRHDDYLAFLIPHTVVAFFNIGAFVMCVAVFLLSCVILQLQCNTYISRLLSSGASWSSRDLIQNHNVIQRCISDVGSSATEWVFPVFVLYLFSLAYQLYGFYEEDKADVGSEYSAVLYMVVYCLPPLVLLVAASIVTGRTTAIKEQASELFSAAYDARTDLLHLLTYLKNIDATFKIAGISATPALSAYVVFFAITLSGVFVRQATL